MLPKGISIAKWFKWKSGPHSALCAGQPCRERDSKGTYCTVGNILALCVLVRKNIILQAVPFSALKLGNSVLVHSHARWIQPMEDVNIWGEMGM